MVSGIDTIAYSGFMDWSLLWLTARFLGHRTTVLRITWAATIGVLPTLWVLLAQNLYAVPWELGLVWPVVMIAVAFTGLTRRFWIKTYVLFIVMALLAGGLMAAGLNWIHWWLPGLPTGDWLMVVPVVLLALGAWMPTTRVRELVGRNLLGQIRLECENRQLVLSVLWDSGNQLTEPRWHRPVVIVDADQISNWLAPEVCAWIRSIHSTGERQAAPARWQEKLSIATFRTLTGEGLLPVVAIERARGLYGDTWRALAPVAVGISPVPVARDGSYHALVSPKTLIRFPNERVGA